MMNSGYRTRLKSLPPCCPPPNCGGSGTGYTGPKGPTGPHNGPKGDTGSKGDTGYTGFTGQSLPQEILV